MLDPDSFVNPKREIPNVVDRFREISPDLVKLVTELSTEVVFDRSRIRLNVGNSASVIRMSRRLEVELTSKQDDGSYTWRAAGAKQPKGSLEGALLYEGAKVGDVVRADADFGVDGVFISAVHAL